jgi:hypothetical protein
MRRPLTILMTLLLLSNSYARAEFVVTICTAQGDRDNYAINLLKLALEKTKNRYGDYRLVIDSNMPHQRRIAYLTQSKTPNLVGVFGYDEQINAEQNLIHIDFPVDLGALGWRICFTNPTVKEKLKMAKSLEDLRKYSIIQGQYWADNNILRENGFNVMLLEPFSSLFKMVASGRADLFCRGFNELPAEYIAHHDMENLTYDESFVFVYKMPLFIYTNKQNFVAKQRIEEGLKIAFADGSVMQLWLDTFRSSITFSNIAQRKIIHLENSAIKNLPTDYEKYLLNPLSLEKNKTP